MNHNDMDPTTNYDDPTTSTEESLERLKRLMNEESNCDDTTSNEESLEGLKKIINEDADEVKKPGKKGNASKVYVPVIALNVVGFFLGGGIITAIISLVWVMYAYSSRCPNCKMFFAMNMSKRDYLGSRDSSWIEDRKIKDSKGKVIRTYEERVHGKTVTYRNHYVCKYCGHHTSAVSSTNVED